MDPELVATRNCYQGWTADKQRMFLRQLAATGSVTRAAEAVGMTARAAYYLRNRPQARAFRDGWDLALRAASDTLVAVAYDRAINGALQKYWQDGKLVGERLIPSDRMLTWLLARIGPDLPARLLGRQETKWEDLEAQMPFLTQVSPNPDEQDEAWRLTTTPTPEPQPAPEIHAALPAPEPTPAHTRPRARTHESA
jgi:hypothetical protein